jgi:hypothetical protein
MLEKKVDPEEIELVYKKLAEEVERREIGDSKAIKVAISVEEICAGLREEVEVKFKELKQLIIKSKDNVLESTLKQDKTKNQFQLDSLKRLGMGEEDYTRKMHDSVKTASPFKKIREAQKQDDSIELYRDYLKRRTAQEPLSEKVINPPKTHKTLPKHKKTKKETKRPLSKNEKIK